VNNSIRILGVVFLTAIYSFAIGVVTKSLAHSDFNINSTTSQEQCFSEFSIKFFCHTSKFESSVNNYINQTVPCFKNPFNGLWAIAKTTEQLFEIAFSQYTNISRNFLIEYRKSDIIFPFHYFW
jgi:hypothetical protein